MGPFLEGRDPVEVELEETRELCMAYLSTEAFQASSAVLAATMEKAPRPEALVILETLLATSMPFTMGGYKDQPWLLMQHVEMASRTKAMFYSREAEYQQKVNNAD